MSLVAVLQGGPPDGRGNTGFYEIVRISKADKKSIADRGYTVVDLNKRVYRAFNLSEEKPEGRELVAQNMAIFNSYFLGGLEVLHEEFVDECLDRDAYLQKMYMFSKNFYESQNGSALESAIRD